MVFSLNHCHMVSRRSLARQIYFDVFYRLSNALADILMLMFLTNEASIILRSNKISKDFST